MTKNTTKKEDVPAKICQACKENFSPGDKNEKNLEAAKYCSDACAAQGKK